MIKDKFGPAVRSESDVGQVNEVLCKIMCHNVCVLVLAMHELGIESDVPGKLPCEGRRP